MKTFATAISCLFAAICFAGLNPVLQNPLTTNDTAGATAFIQAQASHGVGATNITASGVVTGNSGTTATVPTAFSTAGSNYITAIAVQTTNGLATFAYVNTASNQNALANIASNVLALAYANVGSNQNASAIIATNAALIADINSASNHVVGLIQQTNGFVTSAVTNGLAPTAYVITLIGTATNGLVTATVTNGLATTASLNTASNALMPTVANNSYTTNFFFPSYQTNLVFVLPSASVNYLVSGKLYLVARSASPYGIQIASGATIAASDFSGATYSCKPFVLEQSVDGTAFDFGMGGDNSVSFLATNGAPYTLTATQLTNAFSMKAVFDWTIHK